jgi:hypothetical protein
MVVISSMGIEYTSNSRDGEAIAPVRTPLRKTGLGTVWS